MKQVMASVETDGSIGSLGNTIISSIPETKELIAVRKHLENSLKTGEMNALALKVDPK